MHKQSVHEDRTCSEQQEISNGVHQRAQGTGRIKEARRDKATEHVSSFNVNHIN